MKKRLFQSILRIALLTTLIPGMLGSLPVSAAESDGAVITESSDASLKEGELYEVKALHCWDGRVSLNQTHAYKGETVTFTLIPDGEYEPVLVNVENEKTAFCIPCEKIANYVYTFTMPNSSVAIDAMFVNKKGGKHKILITTSEGGSAYADPEEEYAGYGVNVWPVADPGYGEPEATLDTGKKLQINSRFGRFSFKMPDSDVHVNVTFKKISDYGEADKDDETRVRYAHRVNLAPVEGGTARLLLISGNFQKKNNIISEDESVMVRTKANPGYSNTQVRLSTGEVLKNTGTDDNGEFCFLMPASDVTVYVTFTKDGEDHQNSGTIDNPVDQNGDQNSRFTDVPAESPYQEAVQWAVEHSVTTGTSETTFSPDSMVKRDQFVTFLYRLSSNPQKEDIPTTTKFTDMPGNQAFWAPISYAVYCGVTSGTSMTTFSPHADISRAQVIMMLYRAAGTPAVDGATATNWFDDVSDHAYYSQAVAWAVENSLISADSRELHPNETMTRGMTMQLIYNARDLIANY